MHLKNNIQIGEFLCSYFNIEDGRRYTFSAHYDLLFQDRENATEIQKKTCAVYGEGAVTDGTCQKWFAKFLGSVDILAKQFFAVGLSYALEDV